jgi:hypothetical protein
MTLINAKQFQTTKEKLRLLEDRYAEIRMVPTDDENARDITLRSLKQLINQLTEELARYESKTPA